jgi:hypothetical protein
MDYELLTQELLEYYANLLIVQYNGKSKASQTIKLLADMLIAGCLIFQIRDAFDWKTAVGTQLDIIGKWVGVSRFYNASKYWNSTFLSYPSSNDLVPTDKTDTLQHGYSDYANFDTDEGNILTYDALSSVKQSLSDDNYRIVIGLKIIKNNINHIRGEIDKAIWNYFNHRVYTTWDTHEITYNYPPELADIINICAYKKVLPVPIGCSISYYQYS